jgi:hypothetical protein
MSTVQHIQVWFTRRPDGAFGESKTVVVKTDEAWEYDSLVLEAIDYLPAWFVRDDCAIQVDVCPYIPNQDGVLIQPDFMVRSYIL